MKKRVLSTILAIVLSLTMLPMAVFAESNTVLTSGTCGDQGDNVTWTLYDNGELVIKGSGRMRDYYSTDDMAPWRCASSTVTSITIADGVTSIGNYAFTSCNNYKSIEIPDSVTTIGDSAFQFSTSLSSVIIPDGVTFIGERAFTNAGIERIDVSPNNGYYCNDPQGVLYSKDKATLIAYPNGNMLTEYTINSKTTSIGREAFNSSKNLSIVTIPNSVKTLGYNAFFNCTGLSSITIPDSVTYVGNGAFSGCSSLSSVKISSSLTSIERETFNSCTGLEKVVIPNGVSSIGDYAFINCSTLNSVTLPSSVKSIGCDAFFLCFDIKDVYYYGTEQQYKSLAKASGNQQLGHGKLHCIMSLGYDANGGEGIYNTETFFSDETVAISSTVPTFEGKIFEGWATTPDATEPQYQPGDEVTFSADTTLYAVWHTHSYGAWVSDGTDTHSHTCSCGDTQIEAHKYSEWTADNEETHSRTCSCGATQTEEHNWDAGVIIKRATIFHNGEITYTCQDCGAQIVVTYAKQVCPLLAWIIKTVETIISFTK